MSPRRSAARPQRAITVDHGTEFTSKALDEWAYRRGVALDFIRHGKPAGGATPLLAGWAAASRRAR